MKRSDLMAYTLVAGIAIVPVGVRAVLWQRARQQPVDAAMARMGQTLFLHEWTPRDPLAAGGDGLGPVFNATSCVACHHQGGAGGGGDTSHNVTLFSVRSQRPGMTATEGVIHAQAVTPQFQETLNLVDGSLPQKS